MVCFSKQVDHSPNNEILGIPIDGTGEVYIKFKIHVPAPPFLIYCKYDIFTILIDFIMIFFYQDPRFLEWIWIRPNEVDPEQC